MLWRVITISSVNTLWNWPEIVFSCCYCCCYIIHGIFSYIFFQTRERFDTTKIEAASLMSRVQQVNTTFRLLVLVTHSSTIQLQTIHCYIPGACLYTEKLCLRFECAGQRPKDFRFLECTHLYYLKHSLFSSESPKWWTSVSRSPHKTRVSRCPKERYSIFMTMKIARALGMDLTFTCYYLCTFFLEGGELM